MPKINSYKIYSIAMLFTILPRKLRRIFHFKLTPTEHLAVGTTMTKIWYWRQFINNKTMDKTLKFRKPNW